MKIKRLEPRSDEELCKMIANGGQERQRAIQYIYGWVDIKGKTIAYVMRSSGSRSDGMDVFHDGIIAVDRNIRGGKFNGESSLKGYLYSICRFIWNNEWRKRQKTSPVDMQDSPLQIEKESPEVKLFSKEEKQTLQAVLDLLDEKCKQILIMWKLSYSMAEIAEKFQLSNPQLAKKYKYRCMKKLMSALDDSPGLLKQLKDA